MTPTPKVLIVGGGPSGLVLAISLLQNGIPVRVIEKNTTPCLGQRGAGIMPRSLELFTMIRIVDQVMMDAIQVPRVSKYQLPGGTEVIQEFDMYPLQEPTPSCPYPNPVMLGQDRLEKIFHAKLAELGCTVELGTTLVSFTQSADHVEAKLLVRGMHPEAEGVEEVASFEYMVGADGARGVVRKQLGLNFLGETRTIENFVLGDIRVEGLSQKSWHMWGDATSTMVTLRGTEHPALFNFVIAGKNIHHAQLAHDQVLLREMLIKNTNRKDLKFGECPWISYYTPNIRMVDKLHVGRVLIAGDAAHVHSPTGGQGMNTGIQDSFNLGWKLACVIKKCSPPSLLDTYEEERLPVIAEMLNQTTRILETTFEEGEEKAWDKDTTLLQLGVNYRWSSIVRDEREIAEARQKVEDDEFMADYEFASEEAYDADSYGNFLDGHLHAGDRAPNASGLIDRSPSALFLTTYDLFEIFGSHYHTVLIFSELADPRPILTLLRIYPPGTVLSVVVTRRAHGLDDLPADMVLEDLDGHAHNAYVANEIGGVVAIRPDGVVGAIVEEQYGLYRYFLSIFAGETGKPN